MRRIISWEGEEKVPGVIVEPDALTWPEEGVPVGWVFDFGKKPLGRATDIRREEDGSITAEITFLEDNENAKYAEVTLGHGDLSCAMYANGVISHKIEGVRHVDEANIRYVGMVLKSDAGW